MGNGEFRIFSQIHLEALYRLALQRNNPQLTNLMKKYKVGILGYGWAATAHADAINATGMGEVAAVCSSRKLDEAEVSARHGSTIKAYRKLEDMLADVVRGISHGLYLTLKLDRSSTIIGQVDDDS